MDVALERSVITAAPVPAGLTSAEAARRLAKHSPNAVVAERVLAIAALASSADGQDPIDAAIRLVGPKPGTSFGRLEVVRFKPFDPAAKMAEAVAIDRDGRDFSKEISEIALTIHRFLAGSVLLNEHRRAGVVVHLRVGCSMIDRLLALATRV